MRAADFIVEFLSEYGVEDIFLVTGGGSIFLCDALYDSKINYHPCNNEQSVTMAAEGYTRASGKLGVAMVTTGPGCTNAITGAAGAWADSVPQLVISGQVFLNQTIGKTGMRQFGIQEINIIDLVKPITKHAVMVEDIYDLKFHLQKAIYEATHGRPGPVWLDIPANIQNGKIEDMSKMREFVPPKHEIPSELKNQVAEVVKKLKAASRPLVHVGQGVKSAGAVEEFIDLIEKHQLPVLTSRNANDIIASGHELFVGRPGTFAQRGANFAVQNSDVYLAIGSRLSLAQTGYNSRDYARKASMISVDVDSAELNKPTLDIDLKILSDAKDFILELSSQLQNEDIKKPEWLKQCQSWKEKYPVVTKEHADVENSVSSYYFVDRLSTVAAEKDNIVTDMGFSFQCTHQAFKVKKGQKLFTNGGFAAMGWGLPAAIGAAVATKERTFCLCGDGGFMMNPQELCMMKGKNLPIKFFLYNNGGYLTQKQSQQLGFQGRLVGCNEDTGVFFPNFETYAKAHELKYYKINNHQELDAQLESIANEEGPAFIELMMSEEEVQGPRCVNRVLPDGSKKQTPIEDMYPFLDEAEIEKNMNI